MIRRAALVAVAVGLLVPQPASATSRAVVMDCPDAQPECWPIAFDFTPNGRIFYAERITGEIRVFHPRTGRDSRWTTVPDLATQGEEGLLGLALHPDWPDRPYVYAYFTHDDPFENRIVRMRRRGGAVRTKVLLRIPASSIHDGGVIRFSPGGKLFAVTGDAASPARSQDLSTPAGKVLRLNPDGTRPKGNPFSGSFVYSYGHRNSFGIGFDPFTGRAWQSENGPACNDELNRIVKGGNYGWGPTQACPDTNRDGPSPRPPAVTYPDAIVPTGLAFCDRCGLGSTGHRRLFLATFTGAIRRITLNRARTAVTTDEIVFSNPEGVLSLMPGPNRRLYFSDKKGIYRLRP